MNNTPGPPQGFTLPEILLAILLFTVGILGLSSTATFIALESGEARSVLEAAQFAGAQLDSLRAVPCSGLVPGSRPYPQGTMTWTVAALPRTRAIQATLTIRGRHGASGRTRVFDALLPCES